MKGGETMDDYGFNSRNNYEDRMMSTRYTLQEQFVKVYGWMFLGLLITTGVGYFTIYTSLRYLVTNIVFYLVLAGAELCLVWYLSANALRMKFENAMTAFVVYSALNGFTLSVILGAYGMGRTVMVSFLATAITFGFISFIGLVTKQDLSRWGPMLLMGVVGIIIALVVNFFMKSNVLYYLITFAGIAVFLGLTAYHTQKIKDMYYAYAGTEKERNVAIIGALRLYLDFINLFLFILRIFTRRDN